MKDWLTVELTIDPSTEEVISSTLWEEGTLGIVTVAEQANFVTIQAYFESDWDSNGLKERLEEVLVQFQYPSSSLKDIKQFHTPNEDWLKKWKEDYKPFAVGERFLIVPSWAKESVEQNSARVIIELDPGMAFGTGTHETTQLCLRAIETFWKGGRLLDVGTGTAILAIAAAKLHPEASIDACDNDPEAISVAKENTEINSVNKIVNLSVASASNYQSGNYDLIVANLTAEVIVEILDDLVACLAKDGKIVLSGILDVQEQQVVEALNARSLVLGQIEKAGEWISIIASLS